MKEERIKSLLYRYYKGISTEEEEVELRQFFLNETIAGFEAEKELFAGYNEISIVPEPSTDFENRIIRSIEQSMTLSNDAGPSIWKKTMWLNIAAMALAIIGTYIFFINYNKSFDTYDDPHIAYVESVKIYTEVAEKLNIGISALEKIPKANNLAEVSLGYVEHSVSGIINSLNKIVDIGENSNTKTLDNN